jgi:hypothetical protein
MKRLAKNYAAGIGSTNYFDVNLSEKNNHKQKNGSIR